MALQIIDADQPLKVENVFITIYGAPDAGKTTLAQTAESPFLEDYDRGIQRCAKRNGKTGIVNSWNDAVEFHKSGQLKQLGIKTLIVDTVGTMLDDFITRQIIEDDPKLMQANGAMHMRGYIPMKAIFNQFKNDFKAMGIDVIFIAHDTDKEDGGETRKAPKVTGGSFDILKAATDLMGYMHFKNGERFIGFNTTDYYQGKNCAEISLTKIPHYNDPEFDGFMARLIQQTKDKMNALSQEMVDAQNKVDEYREYINNSNNFDELGMIWDDINEGLSQSYKVQVLKVYQDKFITFFEEMVNKVQKPEEMDEVVLFAADQPKQFSDSMRKHINDKMTSLGFKYDKEQNKTILNPDAKQPEPPKDESQGEETPPAEQTPAEEIDADKGKKGNSTANKKKSTTSRKTTGAGTKSKKEAEEQSLGL